MKKFFKSKRLLELEMLHNLVYSSKDWNKCFGIGSNKTATSTLDFLMKRVYGLKSNQLLIQKKAAIPFIRGNLNQFIELMNIFDFHQDVPISGGDFYKKLDDIFPNSKFILTLRDPDLWFKSFFSHYYKNTIFPLVSEKYYLASSNVFPSFKLRWFSIFWYEEINILKEELSERRNLSFLEIKEIILKRSQFKEIFKKKFITRNNEIKFYFKDRPKDFLCLDISKDEVLSKLSSFLNVPNIVRGEIPIINKKNSLFSSKKNINNFTVDFDKIEFDPDSPFKLNS